MTRIEKWKAEKSRAERLRRFAQKVADRKKADIFDAVVSVNNTCISFYGDSSVTTWGDDVREAMQEEIRLRLREIAQQAAERAEKAAKNAAANAKAEAQAVLQEVES